MSNTEIWDALGKTDPNHTKPFSRAGGFKGTATKPIWVYRRLTEQFGGVGMGWGHNRPDFQVVPGADGEVLVYCTVACWHTDRANSFYGVGGDKVIIKDRNGLRSNDEAFKSAFTDAVMNAFKSVGVAADVHMGLFDDDKYVAQARQEFAEPEPTREPTLDDDQQTEIINMLSQMNVPVGDFLAVGGWRDVRDVPASQFELGKKWINKEARKRAGPEQKAA